MLWPKPAFVRLATPTLRSLSLSPSRLPLGSLDHRGELGPECFQRPEARPHVVQGLPCLVGQAASLLGFRAHQVGVVDRLDHPEHLGEEKPPGGRRVLVEVPLGHEGGYRLDGAAQDIVGCHSLFGPDRSPPPLLTVCPRRALLAGTRGCGPPVGFTPSEATRASRKEAEHADEGPDLVAIGDISYAGRAGRLWDVASF